MTPEQDRAHQLRLIAASMNDVLVEGTGRLDMTTREQIIALSMLFASVVLMSHIPEDKAREFGKTMIDAGLLSAKVFQQMTHN